jgi:hypothetical protein
MAENQVYAEGQEIWVQLDVHVPWLQLLGEEELPTPENDHILCCLEEIVGGVDGLAVGAKVTLNEDPENWHGVDGGCWRVSNFLHNKTGVVTGFEDPFVFQDYPIIG